MPSVSSVKVSVGANESYEMIVVESGCTPVAMTDARILISPTWETDAHSRALSDRPFTVAFTELSFMLYSFALKQRYSITALVEIQSK
jgi:hypothetical protein